MPLSLNKQKKKAVCKTTIIKKERVTTLSFQIEKRIKTHFSTKASDDGSH